MNVSAEERKDIADALDRECVASGPHDPSPGGPPGCYLCRAAALLRREPDFVGAVNPESWKAGLPLAVYSPHAWDEVVGTVRVEIRRIEEKDT